MLMRVRLRPPTTPASGRGGESQSPIRRSDSAAPFKGFIDGLGLLDGPACADDDRNEADRAPFGSARPIHSSAGNGSIFGMTRRLSFSAISRLSRHSSWLRLVTIRLQATGVPSIACDGGLKWGRASQCVARIERSEMRGIPSRISLRSIRPTCPRAGIASRDRRACA